MGSDRKFFRPSEVAPSLGITTGRFYQMIRAGQVPATKVGGSIRIPVSAWNSWLAQQGRAALASLRIPARRGKRGRGHRNGRPTAKVTW